MFFRRTLSVMMLIACLPSFQATAAESFPTRQITIVNPYGPGGVTDVVVRALAERLSAVWKQPVVIEYKPGASTEVGAAYVAQSPPDGYTLLATDIATFMHPYLYPDEGVDPTKQLIPVTGLGEVNHVLITSPSFPAHSIADLINLAREKPGALDYAIIGWGSPNHMSMELLQKIAGIRLNPVYYKSGPQAILDVMGGFVSMTFLSTTLTVPPAKAGKVQALGVTSRERLPQLPDLPTIAETVPGYEASWWYGLFAPLGTPRDIITAINTEAQKILVDPSFRAKVLDSNFYKPVPGSAEEFARYVESTSARWKSVMHTATAPRPTK